MNITASDLKKIKLIIRDDIKTILKRVETIEELYSLLSIAFLIKYVPENMLENITKDVSTINKIKETLPGKIINAASIVSI